MSLVEQRHKYKGKRLCVKNVLNTDTMSVNVEKSLVPHNQGAHIKQIVMFINNS